MNNSDNNCSVCCNTFTASTRKEVECPSCQFVVCTECFKRFILETATEPACMACGKGFVLDFVASNTTNAFYNKEFRNHRCSILMSQEKSLLPDTQQYAELVRDCRLRKKQIDLLKRQKEELKAQIDELNLQTFDLEGLNQADRHVLSSTEPIQTKKQFVRACPMDECRGFLSSSWKCGTCNVWICSKCHEPKDGKNDENHVCNEDAVKTAELLAKDTKPCPSCNIPIYKISGCDSMWCVSCHCQFSWKSGNVIHGFNHNPHYYQWLRDNNNGEAPRNPGDQPCGGAPSMHQIHHCLRETGQTFHSLHQCHRNVRHIEFIELHRYNHEISPVTYRSLRIMYLMDEIDEDKWQYCLKKEQKKNEKNREIHQILRMYIDALNDTFISFVATRSFILEKQVRALCGYTNEQLALVKSKYKNQTPQICGDFSMGVL